VTQSQCFEDEDFLSDFSSNRTFCAGFVNGSKSVLKVDKGSGYFLMDQSTETFNLAGIVSELFSDTYSIFTNVGKFVGWIEETKQIGWKEIDFDCKQGYVDL
jgi:secreted trypsin-like serine protease